MSVDVVEVDGVVILVFGLGDLVIGISALEDRSTYADIDGVRDAVLLETQLILGPLFLACVLEEGGDLVRRAHFVEGLRHLLFEDQSFLLLEVLEIFNVPLALLSKLGVWSCFVAIVMQVLHDDLKLRFAGWLVIDDTREVLLPLVDVSPINLREVAAVVLFKDVFLS